MSEGRFTESEALRIVTAVRGVTDNGGYIEVIRGSLGIRRLAALDYLVNHLKRRVIWRDPK